MPEKYEENKPERTATGQWKKGQSGNPNGRPKGTVGLNTRIRELLLEERNGKVVADVLVEQLVKAAIADPQKMWGFIKEFMDRDEGRSDKLDEINGASLEDRAHQLRAALSAMDDTVPSLGDPDDEADA